MNNTLEKVEKIIQPDEQPSKIIQPEMKFDDFNQEDGLLVKVIYDPKKNHIHVEANVQDGDELVLMMLRKAYEAWKKRVYDNIMNIEGKGDKNEG